MNFYETVVILQDSSLQSIDTAVEEFKSILLSMDAKLIRYEDWGAKNFAYPIKRNKRGHYIALLTEASPLAIAELERQFKIKDNILRFLTLRLKKINPKPSILAVRQVSGQATAQPATHASNTTEEKEA